MVDEYLTFRFIIGEEVRALLSTTPVTFWLKVLSSYKNGVFRKQLCFWCLFWMGHAVIILGDDIRVTAGIPVFGSLE